MSNFAKSDLEKLQGRLELAQSEKLFRIKKEQELTSNIDQLHSIIRQEREKCHALQSELLLQYERCAFLDSRSVSFEEVSKQQKDEISRY